MQCIAQSGIYLDRLKFKTVKPIYKKGGKTDVSNYTYFIMNNFLKDIRKSDVWYIKQTCIYK